MTGPGPHTDDDVIVALTIRDLIVANQADLLLDDVLYGNHIMIPRASAAVVTANGKTRELAGVSAPGGRTMNNFMIGIFLHYSKVGPEDEERQAVDARALLLERLLHTDTTLGGLVIHGFVRQVDRGETQLSNGSNFRSVQLIYTAVTKTYLTPTP